MEPRGWCTPIDLYCERADASFWAEPVNALSNGAFLVAAGLAFVAWRRLPERDRPAAFLIAVTASVGIGSFLFHTFANRWSLLADVIPIAIFIYGFFLLAMRRFLRLGLVGGIVATGAFLAASAGFPRLWAALFGPEATLNGSVGYFPAALALIGVGGLLVLMAGREERVLANRKNRSWGGLDETARAARHETGVALPHARGTLLLVAAAVFSTSLVFRSVDQAVCDLVPIGTHFLWHALNAVVLFLCLRAALLREGDAARGALTPSPRAGAPGPAAGSR